MCRIWLKVEPGADIESAQLPAKISAMGSRIANRARAGPAGREDAGDSTDEPRAAVNGIDVFDDASPAWRWRRNQRRSSTYQTPGPAMAAAGVPASMPHRITRPR